MISSNTVEKLPVVFEGEFSDEEKRGLHEAYRYAHRFLKEDDGAIRVTYVDEISQWPYSRLAELLLD